MGAGTPGRNRLPLSADVRPPGDPGCRGARLSPDVAGSSPFQAAFVALRIPGAVLSILSSYYWNRRWTFRAAGGNRSSSLLGGVAQRDVLNQLTSPRSSGVTWQSSAPSAFIGAHLVARSVATVFNFTGACGRHRACPEPTPPSAGESLPGQTFAFEAMMVLVLRALRRLGTLRLSNLQAAASSFAVPGALWHRSSRFAPRPAPSRFR